MLTTLEGLYIGGRYEIQRHIATGGMAAVFQGWDHRVERPVAVKVLRQLDHAEKPAVVRFRREAHAAAMLHHPNVVQAYDFFEEHGCHYLVMEYVAGVNLKQYLRISGPLPASLALGIVTQVCSALQAAHAHGFIHRDIKPHNILLSEYGVAKVTDFGIVHITRSPSVTTDGAVLGTADYIAPEQARGDHLSPATDVYAVGVVLYEMVTGRLPFVGPTPVAVAAQHATAAVPRPRRIDPTISPYVEAVILRALQKRPEHRYHDISTLLAAARGAGLTLLAGVSPECTSGSALPHQVGERTPMRVPVATPPTPVVVPAPGAGEPPPSDARVAAKTPAVGHVAVADAPRVTVPLAEAANAASPSAVECAALAALPTLAQPQPSSAARTDPTAIATGPLPELSLGPADDAEEGAPSQIPVEATPLRWGRLLVLAFFALVLVAATLALEAWLRTHGA